MQLALYSAGVNKNCEVLIPALNYVASTNATMYVNGTPHFIDVEENSLGVDFKKLDIYLNKISIKNLGAITDVTDQFVQLEIKGKNIYEIFSAGSPFNFSEFKDKKGSSVQTILNHIDVIVHNKGDQIVNLFVRRSFAQHLWSWINDSASRL